MPGTCTTCRRSATCPTSSPSCTPPTSERAPEVFRARGTPVRGDVSPGERLRESVHELHARDGVALVRRRGAGGVRLPPMPRGVFLYQRRTLGEGPGTVLLGIVRQQVGPAAPAVVEDDLHAVALDGHPVAAPRCGVEARVLGAQPVEVPARLGVLGDEERRGFAPGW